MFNQITKSPNYEIATFPIHQMASATPARRACALSDWPRERADCELLAVFVVSGGGGRFLGDRRLMCFCASRNEAQRRRGNDDTDHVFHICCVVFRVGNQASGGVAYLRLLGNSFRSLERQAWNSGFSGTLPKSRS